MKTGYSLHITRHLKWKCTLYQNIKGQISLEDPFSSCDVWTNSAENHFRCWQEACLTELAELGVRTPLPDDLRVSTDDFLQPPTIMSAERYNSATW